MAAGLTHDQNNEYTRDKQLAKFFSENTTPVSNDAPLDAEVTEFNQNIVALEALIPDKADSGGGATTETKDSLHADVCQRYGLICTRTHAYALKYGKADLAKATAWTEAKLLHLDESALQPTAVKIDAAIQPFVNDAVFKTYKITATQLSDALAKAGDFKALIGAPKVEAAKSTVANDAIEAEFTKIRANRRQFSLLMQEFKTGDPDFYKGYSAANEMPDLGVRHTGLEGSVTDKASGAPIAGTTVKNVQTGITAVADITGAYSMVKFRSGTFNFEVSAPGYKTQTAMLKIEQGKVLDKDFALEAV